jgi:hypothetical protein
MDRLIQGTEDALRLGLFLFVPSVAFLLASWGLGWEKDCLSEIKVKNNMSGKHLFFQLKGTETPIYSSPRDSSAETSAAVKRPERRAAQGPSALIRWVGGAALKGQNRSHRAIPVAGP